MIWIIFGVKGYSGKDIVVRKVIVKGYGRKEKKKVSKRIVRYFFCEKFSFFLDIWNLFVVVMKFVFIIWEKFKGY